MSETVAFPVEDTEPEVVFEPLADSDDAPLRCSEPGCTNALTYSGRGRKPTKCPEHKRPGARAGNRSTASGKSWPKATEVKSHLDGYIAPINLGLLGVARFTGDTAFVKDAAVIATQLPNVNEQLVELAKDDKDLQRVLESIALPTKYAPLVMALFGLAVPILGNHGIIPAQLVSVVMGGMNGNPASATGGENE